MTGTKIVVDDTEILASLARLIEAAGDTAPALRNIGEHLRQSTIDRFETETAPDGTPWAPLNPLYASTKKGRGILKESGELSREIVYQLAGAGPSQGVEVGTNRLHARVHQFGATIRPKTAAKLVFTLGSRKVFADKVVVPARPFLGISDDDRTEILAILTDFLVEASDGGIEAPG